MYGFNAGQSTENTTSNVFEGRQRSKENQAIFQLFVVVGSFYFAWIPMAGWDVSFGIMKVWFWRTTELLSQNPLE